MTKAANEKYGGGDDADAVSLSALFGDGERVPVGGKFSNGCRYPGDLEAAYAETMNCRCTLVPVVAGIDQSDAYRWSRLPAGMTYEQWKAGKGKAERSAAKALKPKMSAGGNKPIEWPKPPKPLTGNEQKRLFDKAESLGVALHSSFKGARVDYRAAYAMVEAAGEAMISLDLTNESLGSYT